MTHSHQEADGESVVTAWIFPGYPDGAEINEEQLDVGGRRDLGDCRCESYRRGEGGGGEY